MIIYTHYKATWKFMGQTKAHRQHATVSIKGSAHRVIVRMTDPATSFSHVPDDT